MSNENKTLILNYIIILLIYNILLIKIVSNGSKGRIIVYFSFSTKRRA